MKKITIHHMNSVSEYCLDKDKTITKKNTYQIMKQSFFKYQKENFVYNLILKLFKLNNKSKYETS